MIHPVLRHGRGAGEGARTPEARLDEAVGLAKAIALDVAAAEVARVAAWSPAT
ncbi:MAG: GTPase HflX, partial [Alphaproteobacteria bacterium]|nr:GTPase HflX [Alphaproteobacteria bacterium]